jgi:ribosomal protein L32
MARFWADTEEFFDNGLAELDDGKPKDKKKAEKKVEAEPVKCGSCGHLHRPMPFCPNCGHEYPKKAAVQHVPGTLKELIAHGDQGLLRKKLWPQIVSYVLEGTQDMERAQRKAQAMYHELTGTFAKARVETTTPEPCTAEVRNRIRANQIRWAKGRQKAAQREAVPA